MPKTQLNVAVVGLGNMGSHHVASILANSYCSLKYIFDFDETIVKSFLDKNHLTKNVSFASFEEILVDSQVDIVCIASYDEAHFDQVIKSLKANKYVFVEKPLCQNEHQLKKIFNLFQRSKVDIVSNLVLRTSPLYMHVSDMITSGELGSIYAFDGDYLYGRMHKITEGWRKFTPQYSVMEGGGIHMVDLMIQLLGEKPKAVISYKNKIATRNTDFRYSDFHSSMFEFPSGIVGRITANFGCVHRHQHVVRIFGTKGTFIYDDQGARVHWSRDPTKEPQLINKAPKPKTKCELFSQLVDNIIHKKPPSMAEKEFDLMSIILAADKISNKSQIIEYLIC